MESGLALDHVESADVHELLQHVQKSSFNSLTVDGDFESEFWREMTSYRFPPGQYDVTDGTVSKHNGIWTLLHKTITLLRVSVNVTHVTCLYDD